MSESYLIVLGQSQSHETTLTWVMKFSFTLVYNVLCFTRYTCKLQPFFSDVHVRPKFSFARPRWCLGRKYSVCPFKRKKLFAALHKHWNTFNNTLYMYTITNLWCQQSWKLSLLEGFIFIQYFTKHQEN